MPPKCSLCDKYHSSRNGCAADPAQSAPSAEMLEHLKILDAEEFIPARKWLAEADGYDNPATEEMFSYYQVIDWLTRYAALRTGDKFRIALNETTWKLNDEKAKVAQLERECEHHAEISRQSQLAELAAETRAETAESALRQIVGNVDLKQLLEWLDFELSGSPGDGMLFDCKEIISRVAAQTPEEK